MNTQTNNIQTFGLEENFIERIAQTIETKFSTDHRDLSRLAVVFGGKRPSLFLKRALAQRIGQSFYPPVSTYLKKNGIDFISGYRPENIPADVDLIIIGKHAGLTPEKNGEVREDPWRCLSSRDSV